MCALLLLVSILAQPGTGTIFGTVTNDLNGEAIVGAVVVRWEQHASDTALTDSLGFYSLKLTSGRHTARACYQDYVPVAHVFTVDTGKRVRVDFQIHPKPVEMPTVKVESKSQWWFDSLHNDSVLRLLRGLKFVQTRPWAVESGRSMSPDSSAIRFNNEAMKAALKTFQRRHDGSVWRRSPSYNLRSEGNHLTINRGRCRLVMDAKYPNRRKWVFEIDSLRLTPDSLVGGHFFTVPPWAAMPQYVPLQLEAFVRRESWVPVAVQHIVFEL